MGNSAYRILYSWISIHDTMRVGLATLGKLHHVYCVLGISTCILISRLNHAHFRSIGCDVVTCFLSIE